MVIRRRRNSRNSRNLQHMRWVDGRKVLALLRAMPQLESLSMQAMQLIRGKEDRERAQRVLEEVLLLPVAASLRALNLHHMMRRYTYLDETENAIVPLLSAEFLAALPARCAGSGSCRARKPKNASNVVRRKGGRAPGTPLKTPLQRA